MQRLHHPLHRLLHPPRPPLRYLHIHPAPPPRPRLPLHHHPRPPPQPPSRRLLSARTKSYLHREALIAARIVVYGYTGLLLTFLTATTAATVAAANTHPTPSVLPLQVRVAVAFGRAVDSWTPYRPAAIEAIRAAADALGDWTGRGQEWTKAAVGVTRLLAEMEEGAGEVDAAAVHWGVIVAAGVVDEVTVTAALRVAKIAEFRGRLGDAEGALGKAVDAARAVGDREGVARAVTERAVFAARRGRLKEGLEMLTGVWEMRRGGGDECLLAATETYMGEVMFAMGERRRGVLWSRRAFERAERGREGRGCRDVAVVAGRNLAMMVEVMAGEEGGRKEEGGKKKKGGKKKGWRLWGREEVGEEVGEEENGRSAEEWEEAVRVLEGIRAVRE